MKIRKTKERIIEKIGDYWFDELARVSDPDPGIWVGSGSGLSNEVGSGSGLSNEVGFGSGFQNKSDNRVITSKKNK